MRIAVSKYTRMTAAKFKKKQKPNSGPGFTETKKAKARSKRPGFRSRNTTEAVRPAQIHMGGGLTNSSLTENQLLEDLTWLIAASTGLKASLATLV